MRIVRTDSRYSHENTVRFEIEEIDDTELILMSPFGLGDITMDLNELLEEIELVKKASEWVKSKCKEIYRKLEKAYSEEFSEDAAEEWADQWEIQFDEEGNEV
jgi:predicted transcriptional regulator